MTAMAMTNAERQARWRERRDADWSLFAKTARRVLRDAKERQKAAVLERLLDRWPKLPAATKQQLARARDLVPIILAVT
jgi:hypothetical protein